ncbi:MAG: molybdenum cofactor guanylyltransferase MobA [Rhodobacteraceae bacterium]|nr:molybdenum cofactor guanylyltransferase MobA [Paracoccaceae bacterium]
MTKPPGVILAGGLAQRMGGGDKGLLRLDDKTILDHVIARLAPQTDGLAINANGDESRFASLGLPVIADSVDEFPGPLAGVLAGLDWAAERGADCIVTAAADTPFLPDDLVDGLRAATLGNALPFALAATPDPERGQNRHPTFGLWPVALRDDLRAALADGVRKVVAWTDGHGAATALFDTGKGDPFFNVNTPEDLETARRILAEAAV